MGRSFHHQILAQHPTLTYYEILSIPQTASSADVKAAYHRALLLYHPDKALSKTLSPLAASQPRSAQDRESLTGSRIDLPTPTIDEVQQAYTTLSDSLLRKNYDGNLKRSLSDASAQRGSQRPAEVVSLEEFVPLDEDAAILVYPCRCGESFRISEEQLEADVHLIGCNGCSEAVWVGYEAVEEE
ncbi:hypothetical protein DL93DRAFT_2167322 [Clavulina sp. PMI_390]|nr:hypothetical protein DL93DRAFT_2167322 [Clavulina sp. PMI_390]